MLSMQLNPDLYRASSKDVFTFFQWYQAEAYPYFYKSLKFTDESVKKIEDMNEKDIILIFSKLNKDEQNILYETFISEPYYKDYYESRNLYLEFNSLVDLVNKLAYFNDKFFKNNKSNLNPIFDKIFPANLSSKSKESKGEHYFIYKNNLYDEREQNITYFINRMDDHCKSLFFRWLNGYNF